MFNTTSKKLLFIAPLPYPIDGQSKVSTESLKSFTDLGFSVHVINTRRLTVNRSIISEIQRLFYVIGLFAKIIIHSRKVDFIYISLSESYLGNIKDLLLYFLIWNKLQNVTLHMLGGSSMDKLLNKNIFFSFINGIFMKKMNAVIVEDSRGIDIFKKYFQPDCIIEINNFVDDYLFPTVDDFMKKFNNPKSLNILYLSNLLPGKGYLELLMAYLMIPSHLRENIKLTFVGAFPDNKRRREFLNLVMNEPGVTYLGDHIDGARKKELYLKSHIFCLPTYYPFEGQPISILEAYATGCAVITTAHAGISNIFKDNFNGFIVKKMDEADLSSVLLNASYNKNLIKDFAINNYNEARIKYKSSLYREKLQKLFLVGPIQK